MAVLATDTFTRANSSDLGANWTPPEGVGSEYTIASNTAVPHSTGSDCAEYYNAVTWPNDQYSQSKLSCTSTTGGGRGPGLGVRIAPVVKTRYRLVADHAAASNVDLRKHVAGTPTTIWARTQSWTDGATFRFDAQGTTLRAYINGAQVGADTTDASIASGNAGVIYSSSVTVPFNDDWEGGDFTTAGVAPEPLLVRQAVHRASSY